MPNAIERWLLNRRSRDTHSPVRTSFGSEAIAAMLLAAIPRCAACRQALHGHTYRFLACHPLQDSAAFRSAFAQGDWPTLLAAAQPTVEQEFLVAYGLQCSDPRRDSPQRDSIGDAAGGMVVLLQTTPEQASPAPALLRQATPLTPTAFRALKSLCPQCQWLSIAP